MVKEKIRPAYYIYKLILDDLKEMFNQLWVNMDSEGNPISNSEKELAIIVFSGSYADKLATKIYNAGYRKTKKEGGDKH